MKTLLLLAAVMVAIMANGKSTSVLEGTSTTDDQSLLSSLLQASGYSHSCVAGALDHCSSAQQDGHFMFVIEEMKEMVQQIILLLKTWISPPRHCKDLLDSGDRGRGLRQVYPNPDRPYHRVTLYCDHTIDGGGWTVFQRRSNGSRRQDFSRTWVEYQLGFGDLDGEFWGGLDLLYHLTSTTLQELRVDLDDYQGGHRWAKYGLFHVGSHDSNYRLIMGRYSGDAGDSMTWHSGAQFTTHDAEHDTWSSGNCAEAHRGGWWYKDCDPCNLNGYQHVGDYSTTYYDEGIEWEDWRGGQYSLRRTSMMIRPAV